MKNNTIHGVLNLQMRFVNLKKLKDNIAGKDLLYNTFMNEIDTGWNGIDGHDSYIVDLIHNKIYLADSIEEKEFEKTFRNEEYIVVGHFDYSEGVMEHTYGELGWEEFIDGIDSLDEIIEDLKKVLSPPSVLHTSIIFNQRRELVIIDAQLVFGFTFYGEEGEYELEYKGELNDLLK